MLETLYYSYLCIVLTPLVVLAAIIVFIAAVIFAIKTKKTVFIITALISAFIAYQGVPYYFRVKAYAAENDAAVVKNFNRAVKTALFPAQKGLLYADLAGFYVTSKNGPEAIKNYDKAYKYLKSYKSKETWAAAQLVYMNKGDYDKAVEIADSLESYSIAAVACVLKEDYETALTYITKAVETKPSAWVIADRAVIYKNLGREKESEQDYQTALALCGNDNCRKKVEDSYKNYKTWHKESNEKSKKNLNF